MTLDFTCLGCKAPTLVKVAKVTLHVTKNGRHMAKAKCDDCGHKLTRFIAAHVANDIVAANG